jgi:choline dehydrogenase-like flavoprotein
VVSTRVCVVGSGAGGAAAAHTLATAGVPTVLLEGGPHHDPGTFDQREASMMPRLYAEGGLRTTVDQAVVVLSGQGLGGSTLHNTGLCVPPSETLLERWASSGSLPGTVSEVRSEVTRVLARIGATPPPPEHRNRNNALLERAAAAAGLPVVHPLQNRATCSGCGFCTLGCAYNKKRNVLFSHLEEAVAHGLTMRPGVRVRRLRSAPGGVEVVADGVTVRAEHVVLAASAIGSAVVLRASGVRRAVGSRLALHPFAPVAAEFDDPVVAWRGVPQTVLAYGPDGTEDAHRWLWLAGAAPPGGVASQLVGPPGSLVGALRSLDRLAVAGVLLHDAAVGKVRGRRDGLPAIRYWPAAGDLRNLLDGVRRLATAFLAVGARRVRLPFRECPVVEEAATLARLASLRLRRHDVALSSVHPQATVSAGADERRHPAEPNGRLRRWERVWIADGSRFPESVGIPPQVTIMALATLTARALVERLAR